MRPRNPIVMEVPSSKKPDESSAASKKPETHLEGALLAASKNIPGLIPSPFLPLNVLIMRISNNLAKRSMSFGILEAELMMTFRP